MSSDSLNKTSEMREEELKILKEFAEKRKRGLFERRTTVVFLCYIYQPAKAERLDLRDDSYTLFPPDEMDKKDVQQTRSGIQMEGDFHTLLIDRDTTTQVTTLNRVNHFRTLVFMGNGNGVIGYGYRMV